MNISFKNIKLALIYGFFIWLVPFVLSIILFPIQVQDPPFFESIISITLVSVTVYFAVKYFKNVASIDTVQEGLALGILWMLISIVVDLVFFSFGPMKMPFVNYWKDIGFTYLLIPVITTGFALITPKIEPHK